MLFNEIYGCYYKTVLNIINAAIDNNLNATTINEIILENAYNESYISILPAIKNQEWQLIREDFSTPIKNKINIPITILEKRWLRTILDDPKIRLFTENTFVFEDVIPLFNQEDVIYFDRYSDGDNYNDENYVKNFRVVLKAIKNNKKLNVTFNNSKNEKLKLDVIPIKIEYSDKEDKFRLLCNNDNSTILINIGRIEDVKILVDTFLEDEKLITYQKKEKIEFLVFDENNSLERTLLQFANFKKETEKMDDNLYKVIMYYYPSDESELVIQFLSFGKFIKIISNNNIKNKILERINRQKNLFNL